MGVESGAAPTSSTSAKRCRDPEEDVYVDNLHSHKRYLSEIMAYSLNGLTVGDSLPVNIMDSPARSESLFSFRDEAVLQYSPMSEDSDESRFCECTTNTCTPQPESAPTSPISPYRYQKPLSAYTSAASSSPHPCASAISSSQPRQRGSDSEGRFPSSPSDISHSGDLRKAALLRSVQMRTHPPCPSSYESQLCSAHEAGTHLDVEERKPPFSKSMEGTSVCRQEDCSSLCNMDHEFNSGGETRKVLDENKKSGETLTSFGNT